MQDIDCLRQAIEQAVGRQMQTPKDFEFLAVCIFDKTHQTVSVSTLKRLWGYTPQYATTRTATLDLLSRFIGYSSWEDFKASPEKVCIASPRNEKDKAVQTLKSKSLHYRWFIFGGIVLLFLLWFFLTRGRRAEDTTDTTLIIRKGQQFDTPNDYLHLLGITTSEDYWDQPLPHHEGIIVWSPLYQHPRWHNEGNPDSLLPTITEYWTPEADANTTVSTELIHQKNANLYFTVMRTNELRITFMSGLTDSTFIFLGIYRTDLQHSDSTHIVWERIADELDLRNLDYLEQLRH